MKVPWEHTFGCITLNILNITHRRQRRTSQVVGERTGSIRGTRCRRLWPWQRWFPSSSHCKVRCQYEWHAWCGLLPSLFRYCSCRASGRQACTRAIGTQLVSPGEVEQALMAPAYFSDISGCMSRTAVHSHRRLVAARTLETAEWLSVRAATLRTFTAMQGLMLPADPCEPSRPPQPRRPQLLVCAASESCSGHVLCRPIRSV